MTNCILQITLLSDALFGSGSSIPGLVDKDVALDQRGCPYIHGRTVKGLLNEVCADLLYSLDYMDVWVDAADALFGIPGSKHDTQGILHVGHAELPQDLRNAIDYHQRPTKENIAERWTRNEIIESLTAIRQQTAIEVDGAPDPHTLRAIRVVIRQTVFHAPLTVQRNLNEHEQGLLAACVKGLRRAGSARNRGRGRLTVKLLSMDSQSQNTEDGSLCDQWFTGYFTSKVIS